jgi:[amino group carrier protein]-lysine/ornithine hydrolase
MTLEVSNEAEAIAFLTELVSQPSPSGQERLAADCMVREMAMYGAETEIDGAGNAVGRFGTGDNQIVLLGHIDTVPGIVPVRREGDVLYGRGSVDAKGPLAAMAMAAAQVGAVTGWQVVVIGATEEEAATSRGARFTLERYKPRYCIIGEPSGWNRITLGYKGRLLVDYTLEVPLMHTAGDAPGACEQAVAYWQHLAAYCSQYNEGKRSHFGTLDPSLRRINSSDDGLCENVEMHLGLRLPPDLPVDPLLSSLDNWRGEAQVRIHGQESPFVAEKRTPLSATFLTEIRAAGGQPAFVFKTGTSDMNVVGPVWNCPIVAYGAGDSALDHTPQEHLNLDEYLRSIHVLVGVLKRLTTG